MRTLGSRLSLLAAVFLLGAMSGFVLAESGAVAEWRGVARQDDAPAAPADPIPGWASDAPADGASRDAAPSAAPAAPARVAPRDDDTVAGPLGPVAIGEPAREDDGTATPRPTTAELEALRQAVAVPVAGVARTDLRGSFDEPRGGGRVHQALDILAPRGTPVLSAADGRVLKLFTSDAGGLMVYAADARERFVLIYAHLDAYAPGLREGMRLTRGDRLGEVGTTGNAPADTPHLHFAIARAGDVGEWWRGTPVDPYPLLAP